MIARENQTLRMRGRWQNVPLDPDGDPAFKKLGHIRQIFSEDETVLLVNRALYSMKYMMEGHKRRYERLKDERASKQARPPEHPDSIGE